MITSLGTYLRNRKYLVGFVILVIVCFLIISWVLHNYIYIPTPPAWLIPNPDWRRPEIRIDFALLWITNIGYVLTVVGIGLAILQFQAAQRATRRRPDLYLWIGERGQTQIILRPGPPWPLILENRGNGVARHVKVEIDFLMPAPQTLIPSKPFILTFNRALSTYKAHWRGLTFLGDHVTDEFFGKDEYICYDQDYDMLGYFDIRVRNQKGLQEELKQHYTIKCVMRCEGMERKEVNLIINLPLNEPS